MYHINFKFDKIPNEPECIKPLKHVKKTDFIKYHKAFIFIEFEAVYKKIYLKYNYWTDDYTLDITTVDRIKLENYSKKTIIKKHLKDCLQLIKKER